MQLTTYLIFILVLVLEAIGMGFTGTHLKLSIFLGYKFPRCCTSSCKPTSFFYHSFTFKFPLLSLSRTLLHPPHNWGPTHLTILYIFHTPIFPFLISTSTEPKSSSLVSSLCIFIPLKFCSIVCRFSIDGDCRRIDHALVCTNLYTR